MKLPISEWATVDLAFATGHKLTNIHRTFVSPILGHVYFARLDNGPLQRLATIRHQLEREYIALEATQGKRLST